MKEESLNSIADEEVAIRVLAGDTELFAEIVRRYRRPLLAVAISRLQRHDWAEDAVQDAFLAAFRSLHTYNSRFSFRTWLWTIQLNQCHRHLKRRKKWFDTIRHSHWRMEERRSKIHLGDAEADPARQALCDEQLRKIEASLSTLPSKVSDALRLRFFGGLKFQEIADALGCSISSAKNWVRDGLIQMSDLLEPASSLENSDSEFSSFGSNTGHSTARHAETPGQGSTSLPDRRKR